MYAKYTYNAGATPANILLDIKKILTGTTNKSLLSTDCNQAGTDIISTVPAGWVADIGNMTGFTQRASLPNAAWMDVAWNGSVFCAVSGLGSAIFATSPDGVAWSQRTAPVSSSWNRIVWGGGVFCALAGGSASTIAATSSDGIIWTQRTLPSSKAWGCLAYGGSSPLFVAFAKGSSDSAFATSPDGVTWTARTLPAAFGIASVTWNGSLFCAVCGFNAASSTALTSPDGLTWTVRSLPANDFWADVAWNGSLFVAIAGNPSTTANYATSPDGITWTLRTMPIASSWTSIVWTGAIFIAITGLTNAYAATSPDGISWVLRGLPFLGFFRGAAFGGGVFVAVGQNSGQTTQYVTGSNSTANINLRALNADGSTYKYANIDVESKTAVVVRLAEAINGESVTNLCNGSDVVAKCQQIDTVNGGILHIAASKYYLLMLSYKGGVYGTPTGAYFSGGIEISKDDPWASSYPPFVFLPGDGLLTGYLPRTKASASADALGASAVLAYAPILPTTKRMFDSSGSVLIDSAFNFRFSNITSWTHAVIGGTALGGLLRLTDSLANNMEETAISGSTYIAMHISATARILVPKF